MNEQSNIQLIQQAYGHFQTGNIEGVLSTFANDIEWQAPAVQNVPHGGSCKGVEQVAGFFAALDASEEVQKFEPKEYIAQGEKVVVLGEYGAKVKATEREYQMDFVHVFTVRNGKIVGFNEYCDTAVMAAAYVKAQSAQAGE